VTGELIKYRRLVYHDINERYIDTQLVIKCHRETDVIYIYIYIYIYTVVRRVIILYIYIYKYIYFFSFFFISIVILLWNCDCHKTVGTLSTRLLYK